LTDARIELMSNASDTSPEARILELCIEINEHINLMRDYATTPGNVWLAKGELNRINELSAQVDRVLEEIKNQS
jgi:hypothetical protein